MATSASQYDKAVKVTEKAKADIEKLLSDADHQHVGLTITSAFDNILHRLHFHAGSTPTSKVGDSFGPITNFMGDEIKPQGQVTAQDIDPAQLEKEAFKAKVQNLYDSFGTLATDAVLTSYTTPEDQLVLRGVAKQAGVKDYKTAPIDVPFIEAIRQGAGLNSEQAATKAAYDQKLRDESNLSTKPGSATSPSAPAGEFPRSYAPSETTVTGGVSDTKTGK